MPDLESRIPDLLVDLAREMPVDLDRLGGRTLRRARTRRAVTAATTTLVVVALVAGGLIGARSLLDGARTSTLGGDGSVPAPPPGVPAPAFRGIWPSVTPGSLASAQQAVDEGHQPWQLDERMTAEAFAVNVLGWEPEAVESSIQSASNDGAVVAVWHRDRDAFVTRVSLAKLGRTGPTGIWTVVGADTDQLELSVELVEGTLRIAGSVSAPLEGWTIGFGVPDGIPDEASITAAGTEPAGSGFSIEAPAASTDGSLTLLISLVDDQGERIGIEAFPVAVPIAGPGDPGDGGGATGSDGVAQPLPDAVAGTRATIIEAVRVHDLTALAEVIDPMIFVYNFDDGSDPIPLWREDPSVLDPILQVFRLPYVVQEIEGYGTFYVWPYLTEDGSLDEISERERADLHGLGFSDEHIQEMRAFGAYIGPRLAIDADGLWRNYVTGGD